MDKEKKCNWLVAEITETRKTELAGYFCSKKEADNKLKEAYSMLDTAVVITIEDFNKLSQRKTEFE